MRTESSTSQATLSFFGGTGEVTGANFLINSGSGRYLVDCGMIQGGTECDPKNWRPFPYDPSTIDALFVTHAHQDHIGRIPRLVRDGFKGTIFSTLPTKELSHIMLEDSYNVMLHEAKNSAREPLYGKRDIIKAVAQWKGIPYHDKLPLPGSWSATFRDSGHVLGSSMVELAHGAIKLMVTGDLGNAPNVILHDIEKPEGITHLVMESVYGDRNHEDKKDRIQILERAIEDIVQRKGVLLIPSFSLERTQELLYELNDMVEHGRVPKIPIYLDSPLAISVTEIYRANTEFFNKHTRALIQGGDDIFSFPGLRMTRGVAESKAINDVPPPKVIIAGGGMMNGGRILHHALRYLPDERNMLLFVGFQAAHTLGRVIQDGKSPVTIFGNRIAVRAEIRTIGGYSGHAGSDELMQFVEPLKQTLKEVYCVMGEPKAAMFLAQRLRDYVGVSAKVPHEGDRVTLS